MAKGVAPIEDPQHRTGNSAGGADDRIGRPRSLFEDTDHLGSDRSIIGG